MTDKIKLSTQNVAIIVNEDVEVCDLCSKNGKIGSGQLKLAC